MRVEKSARLKLFLRDKIFSKLWQFFNFNFEKQCKNGTNHSCQRKLEKIQTSKIVTIIQNA